MRRSIACRSPLAGPGAVASGSLVLAILLSACDSAVGPDEATDDPTAPRGEGIALTQVASGLDRPTVLAAPPGDDRLFVAEQSGRIVVLRNGEPAPEPFLDLSDRTEAAGERGLLGLAFHPDYAANGRFFVNYTDVPNGDTRVVEFRVSSDPDRADRDSGAELLFLSQPGPNHNGGHLAFGPDGMLFVSTGDGGGAFDPHGHGQDVHTLHGALLRLDVSTPGQAAIPPDNPFAGRPEDGREELWAWGLRNPWRFSFDPVEELLYIADVGQSGWEEVNVAPASAGGLNYGWPIMEGPSCLEPPECDRDDLVPPVLAYPHPDGCAIIGGHVYRGERVADLRGHYVYSDLCEGWIRSFRYESGQPHEEQEWEEEVADRVTSFGMDGRGELYLLTIPGRVYRIDPADAP